MPIGAIGLPAKPLRCMLLLFCCAAAPSAAVTVVPGVGINGGPDDTCRWNNLFDPYRPAVYVRHTSPLEWGDSGSTMRNLGANAAAAGVSFLLDTEASNWNCGSGTSTTTWHFTYPELTFDDGTHTFATTDLYAKSIPTFPFLNGTHRFDVPDELMDGDVSAAGVQPIQHMAGVIYDESEHAHLLSGCNPYWVSTIGDTSLEQAYKDVCEAVRSVANRFAAFGMRATPEMQWPVFYLVYARAGMTVCPKVLKEQYAPVAVAGATGAALEYATDFWVSPDLWCGGDMPGHSPDEYASALLFSYWIGADVIYTEGWRSDFDTLYNNSTHQLTAHGLKLKDFLAYVCTNPRSYTFRDLRPDIAIVRFPDSDWGQQQGWAQPHLYGASTSILSSTATKYWFKIFNVLTHGTTPLNGLSHFNRPDYWTTDWTSHHFFCPINNVAVYDHRVGVVNPALISGDRRPALIFLTGINPVDAAGATDGSDFTTTQAAVVQAVQAGSVAVTTTLLKPASVTGSHGIYAYGKGKWVVSDDILSDYNANYAGIKTLLDVFTGPADQMRYAFGDTTVVFTMIDNDPDRLAVSRTSGPPLGPVVAFSAAGSSLVATLRWTNPPSSGFTGTTIRGRTDDFPGSPSDGLSIAERPGTPGSSDTFVHTGLSAGRWYYAAFTHDAAFRYATSATATTPIGGRADFDADGDVDQADFGLFQLCLTGPGLLQDDPACAGARLDGDVDVDQDDFTVFQQCITGPTVPADPPVRRAGRHTRWAALNPRRHPASTRSHARWPAGCRR